MLSCTRPGRRFHSDQTRPNGERYWPRVICTRSGVAVGWREPHCGARGRLGFPLQAVLDLRERLVHSEEQDEEFTPDPPHQGTDDDGR